MRIRVRRMGGGERDALNTLLVTGGVILAGIGLFAVVLTVLAVLAPWLILAGLIAVAAGWIRRAWHGRGPGDSE